jgi:hypothetical protein
MGSEEIVVIARSPCFASLAMTGRARLTVGAMLEDVSIKRLSKKAKKGMRGWPVATIAFYGPNSSRATKVAVGIVPFQNAEVEPLRDWKVDRGDDRGNPEIAREILEFIEENQALSVVMTDGIIGARIPGLPGRQESRRDSFGLRFKNRQL